MEAWISWRQQSSGQASWRGFLLDLLRFLMRCFFFCLFRILNLEVLGMNELSVKSAVN
jgi:hypothetical protein